MVGILEIPTEPAGAVGPVADANAPPKRIKRLERPSKATLEEDLGKVFEEIDGIQGRLQEIKALIDSKQQKKQASSAEFLDARNRLSELGASFQSVMEEKRALRDELDHADKLRGRMRADARSLREKLPFVKVEQIDEEIKKLEYRMTHTSLTLLEEKKLLQQVKELTKSRDFVKDYNDRLEHITQDETSRSEFMDKIREKDAILNDLKAQQDEQRKIIAGIKEKDASQTVDIPVLVDERIAAFEKIKALKDEVKDLKADFRSREEEYWERERQWKEQHAIQRRKDYEKREADRKEREKIRKQRELENFVEPFTDEIIMVDQLVSYLQKFAPAVEEAPSNTTPQKAEIVAPKGVGTVLVSKKNKFDEENDSWFSGKSKGKKAKAPAAPKNKGKEKLSLSLDALTSFEKVKLSPPTTVGDVTKSVDDLKLRKQEFLKLQKEARERRERGEPEVSTKEDPKKDVPPPAIDEAAAAEPSAVEAENGEEKVAKEVGVEKFDEVESGSTVDLEGKQEEGKPSEVPENLELTLPEDLETKLPADLEAKHPTEEEAKLPTDLDAQLPADLETKLAADLETKLPADLESKLPEDLETKLPEYLETKLPEDLEGKSGNESDAKEDI